MDELSKDLSDALATGGVSPVSFVILALAGMLPDSADVLRVRVAADEEIG